MIIRNLRLKKSWSQKQLAEISGLSVRTIQRIEQGDKPSLESAMSLAAIFEVDVAMISSESEESQLTDLENSKLEAIGYIHGIKQFYLHLSLYVILAIASLILWGLSISLIVWLFFSWGVIVLVHGLVSFDKATFIGPRWEKRVLEKSLGNKI